VLKYPSLEKITLVDLDPAMTQLAQEHPLVLALNQNSLQNPKVSIIHQDAMSYLQSNSEQFDFIIIDLPDPNNENLAKLYSLEFYQLVTRHLSQAGVVVTQATSPYFSKRTFWMINHTVEEAGLVTQPYHLNVPSFGEWGFVMAASPQTLATTPHLFPVATRVLTDQMVPTLFIFDQDLHPATPSAEVSTLFEPIILQAYQEDYKRWKQ
jgi:spermidine synthase